MRKFLPILLGLILALSISGTASAAGKGHCKVTQDPAFPGSYILTARHLTEGLPTTGIPSVGAFAEIPGLNIGANAFEIAPGTYQSFITIQWPGRPHYSGPVTAGFEMIDYGPGGIGLVFTPIQSCDFTAT